MDVLVDTNIILRRMHRAHPQRRAPREAISRLTEGGNRISVASQNLVEVWAVATRPLENNGLGLTPGQAERVLARVENRWSGCQSLMMFTPSGDGSLSPMEYPERKLMMHA